MVFFSGGWGWGWVWGVGLGGGLGRWEGATGDGVVGYDMCISKAASAASY